MRGTPALAPAREREPALRGRRHPQRLHAARRAGPLADGLRAYSAARPPHSEGLAVWIAAYLANEAACANVNLLHLSSRKALEAALTMAGVFPHIDFKREITVGHLLLDVDAPAATGQGQPADPPARGRRVPLARGARRQGRLDRQRSRVLRRGGEGRAAASGRHLAGQVRLRRHRVPAGRRFSEGSKRGLPHPAWPSCCRSTRRGAMACCTRATSRVGFDADLALLDPRGASPSAPPSRPPPRATRRSRARSSPAR